MLTAAHICSSLFSPVLCVPLPSVWLLPFSIFEPTSAESARPRHTNTYINAPDVDIPAFAPSPRPVCMTGAWQW